MNSPYSFIEFKQKQIDMANEATSVKLVIIGDGAVGKTCLLYSYSQNTFPREYEPTIFDNKTTTLKVDNQVVHLGLWDTAGQEEYARLRPLAYNNADIFMVTFSVVDRVSFQNIQKKWLKEVQGVSGNSIVIIVGNKVDLRDTAYDRNSVVSREEARKVAQKFRCEYLECSALTRKGLVQAFERAVRLALAERGREDKLVKDGANSCNCQLI